MAKLRVVGGTGFESRVSELSPWLRALALKLTRSPSDAEDLVQDTIERALRNAERFSPDGHLRAWLSSILNNLFIDRCRQKHLQPTSLEGVDAPAPSNDVAEPVWAKLDESHVRAALPSLPEEFRQVFELHLDGCSYADIATRLGVPRPTVGTRLLRARRLLRDLMSPKGTGEA
ncbi:MAG: RNA polymerase sigma factor [Archangium sp.]